MNRLFFAAALSLLLGSGANAQIATTTALVGTVTDTSGKVVPGATVTAVNTGTIKERLKLQFRAEFFNFLKHPNFSNPASTFGTGTFGDITSTSTENRDIQFGLKLVF